MQLGGPGTLHVKNKIKGYREHPITVSLFQNDEILAITVAKSTNNSIV